MILTKEDLKFYISQDRLMNGASENRCEGYKKILRYLAPSLCLRFLYYLRKEEYYTNRHKILSFYYMYKKRKLGVKLGFTIPANVCGPGLSLPHYGTIVISKYAKVGSNCRLHVGTNIGASLGIQEAPHIGNNVYIGPGAILFGKITIADNITIGANATVNKSFYVPNVVVAGTPAKVVKTDSANWLVFNKVNSSVV